MKSMASKIPRVSHIRLESSKNDYNRKAPIKKRDILHIHVVTIRLLVPNVAAETNCMNSLPVWRSTGRLQLPWRCLSPSNNRSYC